MKGISRNSFLRMGMLLLLLMVGLAMPISAQAAKNKWVTKSGKVYYYTAKGKKAKGLVEIGKKTYYFDKNGVQKTGWQAIKKKKKINYYYFNRNTGSMLKNRTGKKKINGIAINKEGIAKVTKKNKNKLAMLVQAEKVKDQITKPTMSKAEKLQVCFRWVMKFPYRTLRKFDMYSDWVPTYAADILQGDGGNCQSDAAAFAFLANACGYSNVYVCTDTGHSWAEIDGRVYDPLFAEAKSFQIYYGGTYASARLYRALGIKL